MAPLTNKLLAVKYEISGPGLSPKTNVEATLMVEKLIGQIVGVLTISAVIFFIIQIILAGYGFMSSKGDEKLMETNRAKLTNGVLGIVIIVVAIGAGSLISKLLGLENPLDINVLFNNMGLTQ
jgi:hypothetical protein